MEFFDSLRDFIKYSDDKELYKYLGIFGGLLCVAAGLLIYFHYSSVSWHTTRLKKLDTLRAETQKILRDSQQVKAQQRQVEDILEKNKDFRIAQAYSTILKESGLNTKSDQSVPRVGDTVSDKVELQISSNLRGLSMKEVTNFLMLIAQVPQLYTKDITIKRTPGRPTVDVEITVATLESNTG